MERLGCARRWTVKLEGSDGDRRRGPWLVRRSWLSALTVLVEDEEKDKKLCDATHGEQPDAVPR